MVSCCELSTHTHTHTHRQRDRETERETFMSLLFGMAETAGVDNGKEDVTELS